MSDEDHPHSTSDTRPTVSRDDALRAELAGVRKINTVIEGVVVSLSKAKDNMETVSQTVTNANTLLDLWIRILSQTEHTQRLLLSGHWSGATQDLEDIEAETSSRAQEAERRREAERERAVERERAAAEAEARRSAAEKKPVAGRVARGRGGRSGLPAAAGVAGVARGGSRIAAPPVVGRGTGGQGAGRGTGRGRGRGRGRPV